jgi:hypothetical protein
MIDLSDRIELPADVRLEEDALHDLAIGVRYPLGGSGGAAVGLLLTGHTIRETADLLAKRFGTERGPVLMDVARFATQLSRAQLVNVRGAGIGARLRRALGQILYLALAHRWPTAGRERYAIEVGAGSIQVIGRIAAVVALRLMPLWLLAVAVSLLPALLAPQLALASVAAVAGVMAAMIVHESGHALAARRLGVGCFLARAGWRLAVVRKATANRWVDAAGPVACAAIGLGGLAAAMMLDSLPIALGAMPFCVQVLALTVLGQDGRLLVSWPRRVS